MRGATQGASHVDVSISQRTGRRVVSVSDDGVGFDETAVLVGQGIANMRSAPRRSTASSRFGRTPGAERRSRSCSARA